MPDHSHHSHHGHAAKPAQPGRSLLQMGALERLGWAFGACLLIWLLVGSVLR
jgi:hypothetical protein